jgi:hypothetical protein
MEEAEPGRPAAEPWRIFMADLIPVIVFRNRKKSFCENSIAWPKTALNLFYQTCKAQFQRAQLVFHNYFHNE